MTKYSKFALSALVLGAFAFTSCSSDNNSVAAVDPNSIYGRLGGATLVDDPDNNDPAVKIEAGRLAYRSVVRTTVGLIVADITNGASGNLSAHFAPILAETGATQTTSLARLEDNLTDFFSINTGATSAVNAYTGLDMVAAHNPAVNARMGATSTNANYDKFEGYVGAAAVANGVAANTQLYADIVVVLESLRDPIVQP